MVDLSQIKDPSILRGLSRDECEELADDLRTKIIQTVAKNGGHLSSNLGVVEITLALHRVFHAPEDKLVFDVGHQSYAHKLLTGRFDQFDTLRAYGGLSGFPSRKESEYDCFEVGHSSTAISAALGFARARDLKGEKSNVVAVVGDGALTGGMCYEALNDCGSTKTRMIVLLNDNGMSIARNVGALSNHLSALRASAGWNTTKKRVRSGLSKIPVVGEPMYRVVHAAKRMVKSIFVDEGFFSALGFHYLGPINGNDMTAVENMLKRAMSLDEPVLIHCLTKKGYGYSRAERRPDAYHGIPPFFVENGKKLTQGEKANGRVVNERLIELAKTDERIQVVTAAMESGTGTELFHAAYPKRFFDVGIAEEHAVTMSAGMAAGGLRPFFFVYSTFLQRGYDQVMLDVCSQNLPVVLMIDRAGVSNDDGKSHQGLFDIAYLRHLPQMTLLAPASESELVMMTDAALALGAPCAIRYPKTVEILPTGYEITDFAIGKWTALRAGGDATILAVGTMVGSALRVAGILAESGLELEVVNASTIKPLDKATLNRLFELNRPIFTMEEHILRGGFGSSVLEYASVSGKRPDVTIFAVGDVFVPHGDHRSLLVEVGLDDEHMAAAIKLKLLKGDSHVG